MRSRRTLLAVLGGVLAFALVVGAAASLGGITSTNLGANTTLLAACDTAGGISAAYSTEYVATGTPGFKVEEVTIGGVDAACVGDAMTVTLTGAAGVELGEVDAAATTGANVLSFLSDDVLAESVTGIHVTITG